MIQKDGYSNPKTNTKVMKQNQISTQIESVLF